MIISWYPEGWLQSVHASDMSSRGGGAPLSSLHGHCNGMKTIVHCNRREEGTAGISRLR